MERTKLERLEQVINIVINTHRHIIILKNVYSNIVHVYPHQNVERKVRPIENKE